MLNLKSVLQKLAIFPVSCISAVFCAFPVLADESTTRFVKASLTTKQTFDYSLIFLSVAVIGLIMLIFFVISILLKTPVQKPKKAKEKPAEKGANPFFDFKRTVIVNPKIEMEKELGLGRFSEENKTDNAKNNEDAIRKSDNAPKRDDDGLRFPEKPAELYEDSIPKRLEEQSKLERDFEQFLKDDEKEVVNILKLKDGSCDQGTIQIMTQFSKAKVSDLISELESRKIIIKRKKGRKNLIILRSIG